MLPAHIKDQRRWVMPEALNVAPQWVGAPLATPLRRGWAVGLDLLVVALLSGVSGLWLIGGLALVVLQLRSRRGGALSGPRAWVGWAGAALIALLALQEAKDQWDQRRHPVTAAAAKADRAARAVEEAADALDKDDDVPAPAKAQAKAIIRAAVLGASASASAPASTPTSASAAAAQAGASAASAPSMSSEERIAQLETELALAKKPRPFKLRAEFDRLLDTLGAGLGWGIVYFSLLPAWWGGQTVGKKLFGLRVVELTGKPMTVMRCLKRYGGYAAGMATGGLGLMQVLWDPNRQAIQDKTAHTVVIDLRAPRRSDAVLPAP